VYGIVEVAVVKNLSSSRVFCIFETSLHVAILQSLLVIIHCRFEDNNHKSECVCARCSQCTHSVSSAFNHSARRLSRRQVREGSGPSSEMEVVRAAHNFHDSLQHYRSLYINAGGLCHYAAPTEFYTET